MKNKIIKIFAILFLEITLIFLLGFASGFLIGVYSGGIDEGFRLASGVFYNWFGCIILGFIAATVSVGILLFTKKL